MRFSFGMRGVNGDLECPRWFGVGRKNIGHDLRVCLSKNWQVGLFHTMTYKSTLAPDVCRNTVLVQQAFCDDPS